MLAVRRLPNLSDSLLPSKRLRFRPWREMALMTSSEFWDRTHGQNILCMTFSRGRGVPMATSGQNGDISPEHYVQCPISQPSKMKLLARGVSHSGYQRQKSHQRQASGNTLIVQIVFPCIFGLCRRVLLSWSTPWIFANALLDLSWAVSIWSGL